MAYLVSQRTNEMRLRLALGASRGNILSLVLGHGMKLVLIDVTGVFCTSGSEREFTLEGSWYADEKVQAGADCDAAAAD